MKPFFYMAKTSRSKFKHLQSKKRAFKVKQKAFFIIFKGISFAKYCLRPESVPLSSSIQLCKYSYNLYLY